MIRRIVAAVTGGGGRVVHFAKSGDGDPAAGCGGALREEHDVRELGEILESE